MPAGMLRAARGEGREDGGNREVRERPGSGARLERFAGGRQPGGDFILVFAGGGLFSDGASSTVRRMSHPTTPEALLSHLGWLQALARRLVRDDDLADDLVQETLLTAVKRPPRDAGATGAWLR